jgi:hypothetical protein
VIAIGAVFLFGVATTVYLSLRSPEVQVPDVVGKDRFEAERILADADLKFRVRASRPSNEAKPDTVVFQLPRAGEVVKTGQTVAMDISRPTKEGESPETVAADESAAENRNTNSANDNRPRRPKPKNANDNSNANKNANSNTSANKNANSNRAANANKATDVDVPRANVNRSDSRNSNLRPGSNAPGTNSNVNRRPVAPRPTPGASNPTRPNL